MMDSAYHGSSPSLANIRERASSLTFQEYKVKTGKKQNLLASLEYSTTQAQLKYSRFSWSVQTSKGSLANSHLRSLEPH